MLTGKAYRKRKKLEFVDPGTSKNIITREAKTSKCEREYYLYVIWLAHISEKQITSSSFSKRKHPPGSGMLKTSCGR